MKGKISPTSYKQRGLLRKGRKKRKEKVSSTAATLLEGSKDSNPYEGNGLLFDILLKKEAFLFFLYFFFFFLGVRKRGKIEGLYIDKIPSHQVCDNTFPMRIRKNGILKREKKKKKTFFLFLRMGKCVGCE
eukprot:TRINITY_DN4001_c0_g1_i1.p1 TRINITY_DN4001_c0_g1~~TRINITY_DN4001_c0_g1_i1.p1  ORF type:complete len:131 (-),score=1.38 TRINITY_DN4001_c0_g1_i1:43-435(-)